MSDSAPSTPSEGIDLLAPKVLFGGAFAVFLLVGLLTFAWATYAEHRFARALLSEQDAVRMRIENIREYQALHTASSTATTPRE